MRVERQHEALPPHVFTHALSLFMLVFSDWRLYALLLDFCQSRSSFFRAVVALSFLWTSSLPRPICCCVSGLSYDAGRRGQEYNDNCKEVRDLERLSDDTKISWAATPRYRPFKARDFVTAVHYRTLEDGTMMVVNRPVEHRAARWANRNRFCRTSTTHTSTRGAWSER